MKHTLTILLAVTLCQAHISAQVIDLYGKDGVNDNTPVPYARPCEKKETYIANPGDIGRISNVQRPTIQVFEPKIKNAAGSSIIIFPGGGYAILAIDHEGYDVARAFNEMGMTAFVVKNRLPDAACMEHPDIVPLMDAEQAIKMVRENAGKWKIDPAKIGIMGFSAGGHLASTLGTHFNELVTSNPLHTSLRPDFMALIYPVISFNDSITHMGSRNNLIGKGPTAAQVAHFSNELQVTDSTPPTFLVHAADDKAVPVENSLAFAAALHKHKVPYEMHIYQNGGHGFGMNNKTTREKWMERLQSWLYMNHFLQ